MSTALITWKWVEKLKGELQNWSLEQRPIFDQNQYSKIWKIGITTYY